MKNTANSVFICMRSKKSAGAMLPVNDAPRCIAFLCKLTSSNNGPNPIPDKQEKAPFTGGLGTTGAGNRNRTGDLPLTRRLLYHLSYAGENRIIAEPIRYKLGLRHIRRCSWSPICLPVSLCICSSSLPPMTWRRICFLLLPRRAKPVNFIVSAPPQDCALHSATNLGMQCCTFPAFRRFQCKPPCDRLMNPVLTCR